jgi:hypothetical protein
MQSKVIHLILNRPFTATAVLALNVLDVMGCQGCQAGHQRLREIVPHARDDFESRAGNHLSSPAHGPSRYEGIIGAVDHQRRSLNCPQQRSSIAGGRYRQGVSRSPRRIIGALVKRFNAGA